MRRVGYQCTACRKMFLRRHYEHNRLKKALDGVRTHVRDSCTSYADYRTII